MCAKLKIFAILMFLIIGNNLAENKQFSFKQNDSTLSESVLELIEGISIIYLFHSALFNNLRYKSHMGRVAYPHIF